MNTIDAILASVFDDTEAKAKILAAILEALPPEQKSLYFEHGQRVEAYNDCLDEVREKLKELFR